METKQPTPEQKQKLHKLRMSSYRKGMLLGFKCNLLLFVTNIIVLAINAAGVNSPQFLFVGFAMNTFFIFDHLFRENKKEYDRVKEETKKILES